MATKNLEDRTQNMLDMVRNLTVDKETLLLEQELDELIEDAEEEEVSINSFLRKDSLVG